MHNTRIIAKDYHWVGGSDRRLALFENVMPIPRGVSYNAYLLVDEDKTVLLDTADASISQQFFENVNNCPLSAVIVTECIDCFCFIIAAV